MRTAGEIAQRALIRAGVVASGETPTAAELQDAVTTLSDMLDSWSLERLIVFGTTEMVIPVAGLSRITIGPSGTLVAVRPNAVVSAFLRTSVGDTSMNQASPEFLDSILHKDETDVDSYWFSYEGAMPDGVIQLWPVPDSGELHLRGTAPIVQITDVNDELDLPPGWNHAMVLNLAVNVCGEYGFQVPEGLAALAQTAKANIKRANLQPAVATFDVAITANRDGMAEFYYGR